MTRPASMRLPNTVAAIAMATLMGVTTAQAGTPVRGGTLTVGFPSDSKTMNPMFSVQFTERQVLYLVYNTLTKLGPDFSINPELAERWDVEDGGKRIVFHLRKNVKFHDGTDFDAAAVKWNIDQRLDEQVGSPQRKQLLPVVDSVNVLDTHTVEFKLKGPFPALMGMLGQRVGFMVSPAAAGKYGEELASNPVGTGPFVFKEWVRGSHITVERNPDYWEEGLPYLDRIEFKDISGAVVGVQRLKTGEIDYAGQLSPNDVRTIEGSPDVVLHPIKVGRWYSVQWQWDAPPFDNPDLRKAIAHAIDRDHIVAITMAGKAATASGPTPPGLWWYDAGIEGYEHDLDKAKAYLKKAGYEPGTEIVLAAPGTGIYQKISQLVQEQLQAAGMTVRLEPMAQKGWYGKVVKRQVNFTPMRWTQRPDPDGLLYILFHSDGFANTTHYSNAEVDELLNRARTMTDIPKRAALYSQAQRRIVEDLPYVPLFFAIEYGAIRGNVHGFEWIPDQIPRFRELWKSN